METPNNKNEFEILNGGVHHDLEFVVAGKSETRKTLVKKISIRDMKPLAVAWGDMKKEAAIYLGETPDVVAQLSDEAFITVIEEGRRLNFTALSKWLNWQAETLKALGQSNQFDAIIQEAMNRVMPPPA